MAVGGLLKKEPNWLEHPQQQIAVIFEVIHHENPTRVLAGFHAHDTARCLGGWEATGGTVLGGIGAALSLTPWGVPLTLVEIAADCAGSASGNAGRVGFNANRLVGGFLRGSLGHGRNSLIDTRGLSRAFGGGALGAALEGMASLVSSPLNAASTLVWGVSDWSTKASNAPATGPAPVRPGAARVRQRM